MKTKKFALSALALLSMTAVSAGDARYIFYFIGDGMGMGHVNTTETYNRDVLKSERPLLMTTFPVAGQAKSYSASSPITDSAAAGTALSTGHKTNNNQVATSPADSTFLYSIANDLLKAGYAVGVATSVAGDDATPAAFYGHASSRHESDLIAPFAVESGIAFMAGGNFKILHNEEAGQRWLRDMESKGGYSRISSLKQLQEKQETKKVLLMPEVKAGDQIGYTVDSIPGAISLREITEACLETMERNNPERFFMMVEGGNIDWAAHANDGAAVIKEVLNFQDAIEVAYNFYLRHPNETLIVVTADHDTGGMALGREDNRYTPQLELIDFQRISKDRFNEWTETLIKPDGSTDMTWPRMRQQLTEWFGLGNGITISPEEELALEEDFTATFLTGTAPFTETWYQTFKSFTTNLYDLLNRKYGIGWTSSSHTANFTPVYAVGTGSEKFGRTLDNTEIPMLIMEAAAK